MKILEAKWFCGSTNVGIVKVETNVGEIKYYIGACSGIDEEIDQSIIADHGSHFPKNVGDLLFSR